MNIFDERPELFIDGFFAQMTRAGHKTSPDEPKTGGLPTVPQDAEMEVVTCFRETD